MHFDTGLLDEIYLDFHATTPVDPRVADAVLYCMRTDFGNANSVDHRRGERAASLVEEARSAVADLVGAIPDDVYFTSGSTNAIELAIAHAIGSNRGTPLRVLLTRVEHPAVIDTLERAQRLGLARLNWLEVGPDASINLSDLEAGLGGADLLCMMAANNEVGTIYPVEAAYERASQQADCRMLVDATQAVGRVALDMSATPFDYLVISGHKIYGPKGVGALVAPVYRPNEAFGLVGAHSATLNVPGIVGLGVACRILLEEGAAENQRLATLRDELLRALRRKIPDLVVNGSDNRLPGNLHISVPGAPNDLVVQRLRNKVAVSTGAACMSGAPGPSHVLLAMGLNEALRETALRISVGRTTTEQDLTRVADEIAAAVNDVRQSLGELSVA